MIGARWYHVLLAVSKVLIAPTVSKRRNFGTERNDEKARIKVADLLKM